MRQGRSSTKIADEIKVMVEIDHHYHHHHNHHKLNKTHLSREEPHLSGAYIRSLVKQLTSSTSSSSSSSSKTNKDSMNHHHHPNKENPDCDDGDGDGGDGDVITPQNPNQNRTQQQQPHKKQVRRRLHTTRPYQERLLNMAEARREIVTALKFHRAAMKQAATEQPTPPPHPQPTPPAQPAPGIPSYPYSHPPNPYSWPAPATTAVSSLIQQPFTENLNFTLPNQPLGLNLNFHDFNNIDTSLYHNKTSSIYSTSSPSPSSSIAHDHHEFSSSDAAGGTHDKNSLVPVSLAPADVATTSGGGGGGGGGLHAAMDDEEMAEIRSIGEKHQVEWSDTMNLVTSAWWFKFLRSSELGGGVETSDEFDDNVNGFLPFGEVMEFPAWLSSNETCFDQQRFDDRYCSDEFSQAPALPCMDIEEIEGMDGDWLS